MTQQADSLALLRRRQSQAGAVARLGGLAIAGASMDALFDEAVVELAAGLEVEMVKILEMLPDGAGLLLRAGIGWDAGLVGEAVVPIGKDSQAGHTLGVTRPVVVEDLRADRRFSGPPLLSDHGVVSGISTVIPGTSKPWGVLGAHSRDKVRFSSFDIDFVTSMANLLADAIRRERVEQELRAQEDLLSAVIDTANDAIIGLDAAGLIMRLNRAAVGLFDVGHAAADAVGTPITDLIPEFPTAMDRLGERSNSVVDLKGVRGDGGVFPIEVTVSLVDTGASIQQTVIVRDLTDRLAVQERLAASVKAKDEFIASVAHELRTPLTAVLGMSAEVRDRYQELTDEEITELVSTVAAQATEMSALVEDLLVAARADIDSLVIDRRVVEVSEAVAGTMSGLRSILGAAPELSIAPDLRCVADPIRIRQVLRNLLVNAHRYGGQSFGVDAAKDGDVVAITVWDSGPGIDDEALARVFEPYERAHVRDTQPASVGLGLTVARRLARLMGGDLTYGRFRENSAFFLTLSAAP